jgi:hypothetical protein
MLLRQIPEPVPSADVYLDKELSAMIVDYIPPRLVRLAAADPEDTNTLTPTNL